MQQHEQIVEVYVFPVKTQRFVNAAATISDKAINVDRRWPVILFWLPTEQEV